jgi:GT2 family glycosyltransferase
VISVVLPYKDAASTLGDAIDSVLAEAACGELIAVDDGSSDDSSVIVKRAAARDRRVVPVSTGGVGVAEALATGVEHARGELIGRMDADDVSLPGRLAAARALLDRSPSLAVAAVRVEAFPAPGPGLCRYVAWQNGLLSPEDHARDVFVEAPVCHPSVVMRRAALDAVGGYRPSSWPEDYDLWLRLCAAGWGIAKSPEVLFRWRHHDGRVTLRDPRCSAEAILDLRARALAAALERRGAPFVVWGAGRTGKRLARGLEAEGFRPEAFLDIDPKKIGGVARGKPILSYAEVTRLGLFVIVAVGAQGARDSIRKHLRSAGLHDPGDFVCAA